MFDYYGGWHWMWIFPLLFFIVFIIAMVLLLRRGGPPMMRCPMCGGWRPPGWGGGESAKEILERRYARGEISREEYQTIKQDLERSDLAGTG